MSAATDDGIGAKWKERVSAREREGREERQRERKREKGVGKRKWVRDCVGSRRDSRLSIIRLLLKPRQELPATKSKKFLARFSNVFGAVSTTTMRQHHEAGRQAGRQQRKGQCQSEKQDNCLAFALICLQILWPSQAKAKLSKAKLPRAVARSRFSLFADCRFVARTWTSWMHHVVKNL